MRQHPHTHALTTALKVQIRQRGSSAAAVSRALGQHTTYLSRALSGRRPLRVEVVFEVLHQLHILPFEFFWMVFPFGGTPLPSSELNAHRDPAVAEFQELTRRIFRERGRQSAESYRLRLGDWLKEEILRRGRSVRQVSLALGLGPTALGKSLRAESQLTFEHVFHALAEVGTDPGRLFASLFLPHREDPVARESRERVLRYLEESLATGDPAFEALRKRKLKAKREAARAAKKAAAAKAAKPRAKGKATGKAKGRAAARSKPSGGAGGKVSAPAARRARQQRS